MEKPMRKLVTIEKIEEVLAIDGADKIEKVRVKGWWVVARKGEFQVGDLCVFHEIDSFLPITPTYEFLLKGSPTKTMLVDGEDVKGIRLRTIKLRGQISQGLVLPVTEILIGLEVGTDVSSTLGVIKFEPQIPANLSGQVKGTFPAFIPKTDEERIQNMSDVLSGFYVTEKLDGTSVTFFKEDGVFGVCSRNLELADSDVTQWQIARALGLVEALPDNIALQGELVGEGIQKNPLKIKGQKVFIYSAFNIATGEHLPFAGLKEICKSLNLETVPIIDENFTLPATVDEMLKYADGMSMLNPAVAREGVVVRSKGDMTYNGHRLSFKAISNQFLLSEE